MANYIIEIKGNRTLEKIALMISAEENTGAAFVKSSISFHEHAITNLVTFDDSDNGDIPSKPLIFREGLAPASDGMPIVWAGVLLTSKGNVAVTAYR